MPTNFEYQLTDTVNGVVAPDQMRLEIFINPFVTQTLMDGPSGLVCTKDKFFLNFVTDLGAASVTALNSIVSGHTGVGLPSPDEMDSVSQADLPSGLSSGSTFYVTDGNEGPGPAWYDGTDWHWYASGNVVLP